MICNNCHKEMFSENMFCPHCGAKRIDSMIGAMPNNTFNQENVTMKNDYVKRFGEVSEPEWRTKLLAQLLKSDGIIFLPGWEQNPFSALEKDIATVCRKTTVKVFPSIGK